MVEDRIRRRAGRQILRRARTVLARAVSVLTTAKDAEERARSAYDVDRELLANHRLAETPVSALRDLTNARVRIEPVEERGFHVSDLISLGPQALEAIPGVGAKTAARLVVAARHLREAIINSIRVRLDPDLRTPSQTELLRALHELEATRSIVEPFRTDIQELAHLIGADLEGAELATRPIRRLIVSSERRAAADASLAQLQQTLDDADHEELIEKLPSIERRLTNRPKLTDENLWADYGKRAVSYNGMLIEVGGLEPEADPARGLLAHDVVQKIEAFTLDTSLLKTSLRGYQRFAAKFALVQKRVIIGDEMGLGKTIEALAVMSHLNAVGRDHFLVVCPASVLVNWTHEVHKHSDLRARRIHGADRDRAFGQWSLHGGVGITTFDTLKALPAASGTLGAVVVDEAHYAKNPKAQRTKVVNDWLQQSEHAMLLSGTPMENRVDEFKVLLRHVQPDLARRVRVADGAAGADHFRRVVAPAYLRRNREDVLDELPPRIETEEWVPLTQSDEANYRTALLEGNFMALRRAAVALSGPIEDCAKLQRLWDICNEAMDNGRKVVVFSFFLDVLDRINAIFGDRAVGPIVGSVPAARRQELIDEFSQRPSPAVLIAQVQAGGVGVNIQAGSVVVITEPQWKPSTEEQAIARCHRLGQVRTVDVHRLLAVETVDEHMLAVIAGKSALFDTYIRESHLKLAAPDAIDATSDDAADEKVSPLEHERRIIDAERRRLGLNAAP